MPPCTLTPKNAKYASISTANRAKCNLNVIKSRANTRKSIFSGGKRNNKSRKGKNGRSRR
jgi:hypothetical protein